MNPETDSATPAPAPQPRKPRIAYLIATSLGLGYLKPGPGTWGSLVGLAIATFAWWIVPLGMKFFGVVGFGFEAAHFRAFDMEPFVLLQILIGVGLGLVGVFAATQVSFFSGIKDPQFVVIDEVSGQQLTLLLGGFGPARAGIQTLHSIGANHPLGFAGMMAPNWKYLLLGFILFRGFDIWKPFPVRQAESLPGGWGIMADDWLAAVYAAAGLWIARALGL